MNVLDAYAPERIGYRYGVPDAAYRKGYHRGQDVRRLNESGSGSVVTDVAAIDGGRVVYVGRPNDLLELTVVIDTGRSSGRFESHSHMADAAVSVGDTVESGQRLGRNAQMWESPGQVDGVHDHITVTDFHDGAWMTSRPEYDPLLFIIAARIRAAQPAGGAARPFQPEPLTTSEADMATFVRTPQHGHYSVAPGCCIGIGDPGFIDRVVARAGTAKPLVLDVTPDELATTLFYLSGVPASQIPGSNYAWFAAVNPTS